MIKINESRIPSFKEFYEQEKKDVDFWNFSLSQKKDFENRVKKMYKDIFGKEPK